jgi:hypothetical protein
VQSEAVHARSAKHLRPVASSHQIRSAQHRTVSVSDSDAYSPDSLCCFRRPSPKPLDKDSPSFLRTLRCRSQLKLLRIELLHNGVLLEVLALLVADFVPAQMKAVMALQACDQGPVTTQGLHIVIHVEARRLDTRGIADAEDGSVTIPSNNDPSLAI